MLKQRVFYTHLAVFLTFVLYILYPPGLYAQNTPAENSELNYRIIGFSFEAKKARQYVVEIASGRFNNYTDFTAHVCIRASSTKNKKIIEVPSFGSEYTWRVLYKNKHSIVRKSDLLHFSTGTIPDNGTTKRLRINTNTQKYNDSYILIDGCNLMYDMNGEPVWYMPGADSMNLDCDVKVSPSGTITFLARANAYEISYSGKILWKAKNSINTNSGILAGLNFHHEFSKLRNGHYMALIAGAINPADKRKKGAEEPVRFFPPMQYSLLAEFDASSEIVWWWETSKYRQESDLAALQERYPAAPVDMHENAFWFSEQDSNIYISMAGINRIVKIQYPSGKVLNEFGNKFSESLPVDTDPAKQDFQKEQQLLNNNLFCHQHSLKRSDNGFLYVFNNNLESQDTSAFSNNNPHVLKLKEAGDRLEKAWDFDCKLVTCDEKMQHGGGGNVVVLPGNSLFVSMSSPYGDMFIVDTNKTILWSAVTEIYQPATKSWIQRVKYRASIVTLQQMEQLIWHE